MSKSEGIDAAVSWWASFVTATPKRDAKLNSPATETLISFVEGRRPPVPEEQAASFRTALHRLISAEVGTRPNGHFGMGVDYSPCVTLGAALEEAGLRADTGSPLPWKSDMRIEWWPAGMRVVAKEGYGNPFQQVYPVSP